MTKTPFFLGDILIMPDWHGIMLLESLAYGTPVVATEIWGHQRSLLLRQLEF
jgi:hypothetical protein